MQSRSSLIKKAIVISAVVTLFVFGCQGSLNPFIWKSQIERFSSPEQLVQPQKVAQFYEEMREGIKHDPEEIFLYTKWKIPYSADFVHHGALNHLATAEEVLQSGKEDCDGQAVLLCSVLRYAGYSAYAVIGPSHAWVEVKTDELLRINYRGGDWFVKFNETGAQWNSNIFLLMITKYFLLLAIFFFLLLYGREKGFFRYVEEYLGFLKYIIAVFFVSAVIIIIFAFFWTPGTLLITVSALVVFEVIARLRKVVKKKKKGS